MALVLALGPLRAAATDVPAPVLGIFLRKVMTYDRSARSSDAVRVLVVHDKSSSEAASAYAKGFAETSLSARTEHIEALGALPLDDVDVVFLVPGTSRPELVGQACERGGALSVTVDVEHVEAGMFTLGVSLRPNGKPKLTVHLARMRAERRALTAALLNLATVIH